MTRQFGVQPRPNLGRQLADRGQRSALVVAEVVDEADEVPCLFGQRVIPPKVGEPGGPSSKIGQTQGRISRRILRCLFMRNIQFGRI